MKRNFKLKPFENPHTAMTKLIKSVTSPSLPKNTMRNVFTGNSAGILNNFGLKKFGGKNDVDFDGLLNNADCNPFSPMRQDFSPFRDQTKAEQMSAARRFGGQNLKGLQRLGQGRDRVVYALDKDKVLKVAKNPGGLTQNTAESDLNWLGLGEEIETGMDYVVARRNNPLSQRNKRKLAKIRKTYRDEYNNNGQRIVNDWGRNDAPIQLVRHSERFSGDNSVLDEAGIGQDILNYDFNPHELFANRQWGEDNEGNLALNDGGALQDNDSLRKHRVKDFQQVANMDREKEPPWQLKDWNEVQRQRKQYREKGNYNPNKIKQFSEPASYNEDITINTFKRPGGKLEITEYPDGNASVSGLYVDEDYRRQGIATELLEKAKNKYGNIHAQVSNVPSVKTHYRAGFRVDDNPNMTEEEAIDYFKEKETGPGSIGMIYNKQIPKESNDALFADDDGDGVANYNDCDVNDPNKQGPWHTQQTLWHAGDQPPSETLKQEGRVFGFSSKEYAEGWKEKHNKANIYQFNTDEYNLDEKSYVRPLKGGKKKMSDNEYIALNVEYEDIYKEE